MLDSDTVVYGPGAGDDPAEKRVQVVMKTRGCKLMLFFDDLSGEGPVRELRLLPDAAELEPQVLRQLAPQAALYVQYARATIKWEDDDARHALRALRELGSTRRGLSDEFYRRVATSYAALLAAGERHPVKALSAMHHVTISTASRWVSGARERGYIPETRPVAATV